MDFTLAVVSFCELVSADEIERQFSCSGTGKGQETKTPKYRRTKIVRIERFPRLARSGNREQLSRIYGNSQNGHSKMGVLYVVAARCDEKAPVKIKLI